MHVLHGKRLVILAGVLLAGLIGLGAAYAVGFEDWYPAKDQ